MKRPKVYAHTLVFVDGVLFHQGTMTIGKDEWKANESQEMKEEVLEAKLKMHAMVLSRVIRERKVL